MKLAHLTKLSDLLDYGIKDLEASGLNYNPAVWLRANECCVAGGVMHQTFGIAAAVGEEVPPSTATKDYGDANRLRALSDMAFNDYRSAARELGVETDNLPESGCKVARTIEELKARVDFLRLLGL